MENNKTVKLNFYFVNTYCSPVKVDMIQREAVDDQTCYLFELIAEHGRPFHAFQKKYLGEVNDTYYNGVMLVLPEERASKAKQLIIDYYEKNAEQLKEKADRMSHIAMELTVHMD